jgi:hypothetical protein
MTLASNLRENKAVYAVAGAGDFAVEKLREVPGQVDRYRGQVRETVDRYRGEVSRYQERVDAKDLPGAAVAYATHFGTRAVEFIDELAERGRKVVNREAVQVAEITESDAKPVAKTRTAAPRRTTGTGSTRQARTTAKKERHRADPAGNTRPGSFVCSSRPPLLSGPLPPDGTHGPGAHRVGAETRRVRDKESPSETSRSADRRCRASMCWTTSSGCC